MNTTSAPPTAGPSSAAPSTEDAIVATPDISGIEAIAPPPCYFWNICAKRADIEKAGRSVCSGCSANVRGFEYPLRGPSREPLYASGREVAEAMNILD